MQEWVADIDEHAEAVEFGDGLAAQAGEAVVQGLGVVQVLAGVAAVAQGVMAVMGEG